MKTEFCKAIVVLLVAVVAPVAHAQTARIAGFTAERSAWECAYEALLKAIPESAVCRQHSTALTEHPTLVGSDWDWRNVQYSLEKLRSYGLEPELKTYHVYMSLPRSIQVEMVAPTASVYPNGPWRPADGVQRGTLIYLFDYAGDPLTPGWAATERAHRLDPREASNLPHAVPTTPLAYGEAEPLLRAIGGPAAPSGWQGGLPFVYHLGPGPAKVHLKLDIDYQVKPVWDVVVKIPGTKYPDQWVVLGAHRDGWTYGSGDSNSGFVVVMELARALAQLQRQGWRPERTIGLAGCTASSGPPSGPRSSSSSSKRTPSSISIWTAPAAAVTSPRPAYLRWMRCYDTSAGTTAIRPTCTRCHRSKRRRSTSSTWAARRR